MDMTEPILVRKGVPMTEFLVDRFAAGLPWDIIHEQFKAAFDANIAEADAWHILETTLPDHEAAIKARRDEQAEVVRTNDLPSKILRAIDHIFDHAMDATDAREKAQLFAQFARLYEILSKREDFKKQEKVQNVIVLQNNCKLIENILAEDLKVALSPEQRKKLRRLFKVPEEEEVVVNA
jgi:hypothetical protein